MAANHTIHSGNHRHLLLPVAYYTGDDFKSAKRPPADNFIHWNRWGEHRSPAG